MVESWFDDSQNKDQSWRRFLLQSTDIIGAPSGRSASVVRLILPWWTWTVCLFPLFLLFWLEPCPCFGCLGWGHSRAKRLELPQLKQRFVLLGWPGCLLLKDVLTGILIELFLRCGATGMVHLFSDRRASSCSVLVLVVLLVCLLPRGMNFVHVISHPLKSMSQVSCLRVRHFTWGSLSSIGNHDSGIRDSE
jgi:hypothetical protein